MMNVEELQKAGDTDPAGWSLTETDKKKKIIRETKQTSIFMCVFLYTVLMYAQLSHFFFFFSLSLPDPALIHPQLPTILNHI